MKKKVIQILSIALCMVLLSGSTVTANAAKKSSNTGAYQAVFDAEYYYNSNPDLQAAFGYDAQKLFNHFVSSGIYEGRSGCANFNVAIYRANYPDLQAAFGNDLASYCAHYAANGAAEGRNATTLISAGEGAQAAIVRGSCTTKFDPRASRATNIAVAASRINGVVIQPGEEFSFNRTILPRTAANGYVEAPIYVSGKHSTGTGGGICQVSTTLYQAVLQAELEVTERHNHSMIVKYVEPSMDAAIAEGAKDFRFVNNTEAPIYIEGYTYGGKIYFNLYGEEYRSADRKVTYESETLETIDPTTELTADPEKAFGSMEQIQSAHTGYKAKLWKIVTENGEQVSKEEVNNSYYQMTPNKYKVGVKTSNAEASSAMYTAIANNDLNQVYVVLNQYGG